MTLDNPAVTMVAVMLFKSSILYAIVFCILGFSERAFAACAKNSKALFLIEKTPFSYVLTLYSSMLKDRIQGRIKSCAADQKCIDHWKKVQADQLALALPAQNEVNTQAVDMVCAEFSESQIEWLVKAYEVGLMQKFSQFTTGSKFADSVYSSANSKVKQIMSVNPYLVKK